MRTSLAARRSSFALALGVLIGAISPTTAYAEGGVGAITGSPALFASYVSGSQGSYFVFAYHLEEGSSARVIAVPTSTPFGPTPFDDVVVDSSVLSIAEDAEVNGLWNVSLDVTLPVTGVISLRLQDSRRSSSGTTCQPWYSLRSPSASMSHWGNVKGTINGDAVESGICTAWGSDIYGYHTIWPLGTRILS